MDALVTGGLGFIGSHLVDFLISKGFNVTVVDNLSTGNKDYLNAKAHYLFQDTREVESSVYQAQDYIFHCAALPRIQPSFDEPLVHEEANVCVTIDLVCKLKGSKRIKKIVVSASSAAYGTPTIFPTPETASIAPLSPYALQKYASEQNALILGERYGIPVVALRYFNVYGPRSFNPKNPYNAYSSVIGIFANQFLQNEPIKITGDGSQSRDFIHVLDVVNANYLAAISEQKGKVYNVGSGSHISILDLAKKFSPNFTFIPKREGEASITFADITLIQKELGWSPQFNLDYGIKEACLRK